MHTVGLTRAIKGMETVRLTAREWIFTLMIVLNRPIQVRSSEDRMKIARRLKCSDRTVQTILLNLKRAGVLEMDARKVYEANYKTEYADEMLRHVMDNGSDTGFSLIFQALEVDHSAFTMAAEQVKNRTTADKPTYERCHLSYLISMYPWGGGTSVSE